MRVFALAIAIWVQAYQMDHYICHWNILFWLVSRFLEILQSSKCKRYNLNIPSFQERPLSALVSCNVPLWSVALLRCWLTLHRRDQGALAYTSEDDSFSFSAETFSDSQVWNMDRKSQPMHIRSPYDLQPSPLKLPFHISVGR